MLGVCHCRQGTLHTKGSKLRSCDTACGQTWWKSRCPGHYDSNCSLATKSVSFKPNNGQVKKYPTGMCSIDIPRLRSCSTLKRIGTSPWSKMSIPVEIRQWAPGHSEGKPQASHVRWTVHRLQKRIGSMMLQKKDLSWMLFCDSCTQDEPNS